MLPVKTVGDELATEVGAEGVVVLGDGVGAVDPGTYAETVEAAGDEAGTGTGTGAGAGAGVGVGASASADGVEDAAGVGLATMTGGGGGAGATKTGTGGEGAAVRGTGAEAEAVVTDAEVAMMDQMNKNVIIMIIYEIVF